MNVRFACSFWGQEATTPTVFLARVLMEGFEGVEINPPEDKIFADEFQSALASVRLVKPGFLFIAQQVLSPADESVDAYLARMRSRLEYLASLPLEGVDKPAAEFVAKTASTDEQGNQHIRMDQVFQGLPVWGSEVIAHTKNGAFERVNGRYFPTPEIASIAPALSNEQALTVIKNQIGLDKIKTNWTPEDLKLIDGAPFSAELLVYHPNDDLQGERQQLIDRVFADEDEVQSSAIDVLVHRLRKRLQDSGVRIHTYRGLGYVLEIDPAGQP